MSDISKIKIGDCTEDDSREIPEYILSMSAEERQKEMDRLYDEMKTNPIKKEKPNIGIKTILDT